MFEKYKEYNLYYDQNRIESLETLKAICRGEYKVLEVYKDTERNYVVKIEVLDEENGEKNSKKKYILKKPKAETVIPQRKVQTFFKKGEALTLFTNYLKMEKYGFDFLPLIYGVGIKKDKFITESFILMEVVEGEILRTVEDIDEVVKIVKKLHKIGVYHGDLNTSNFIKTSKGLKVIDTQLKSEKYTNFHRSYDVLTLENDLLVQGREYNVQENLRINKGIGYSLAYFIKNIKKIKLVKWIRGIKQKLRVKGWKI